MPNGVSTGTACWKQKVFQRSRLFEPPHPVEEMLMRKIPHMSADLTGWLLVGLGTLQAVLQAVSIALLV